MIYRNFWSLKKSAIYVALCISVVMGVPAGVHAATPAETQQQIQVLLKLLVQLQKQLADVQAANRAAEAADRASVLGIFMENLSNPTGNEYRNGMINATTPGDRVAVGWRNMSAENCVLTDPTHELKQLGGYAHGSESTAQLEVDMPFVDVPKIYTLTLQCMVSGKSVSESFKINFARALEKQQAITNPIVPYVPTSYTGPAPLYKSPDVKATMNVVSLGGRTLKVLGHIVPPASCLGTENMEVELWFDDERKVSYILSACKPRDVEMTATYEATQTTVFPYMRTRWLNATNNNWTYTELARVKVDFNDTGLPTIVQLRGGSKG